METETIEDKIREALKAELERQLGQRLQSKDSQTVAIGNGTLNLDDLAAAIAGAVAGGP